MYIILLHLPFRTPLFPKLLQRYSLSNRDPSHKADPAVIFIRRTCMTDMHIGYQIICFVLNYYAPTAEYSIRFVLV
jgi:hypothetical protein